MKELGGCMNIGTLVILILLYVVGPQNSFAKTYEVGLTEKVFFSKGDIIKLKHTDFSVEIGFFPGTTCAVPGFNCGSGYRPPSPTFEIKCGTQKSCPYIVLGFPSDGSSGSLTIESEESCAKNDPKNCFYAYARQFKSDDGCMKLKSPLGRYYCLELFSDSKRPENRGLCEQLPAEIYALRWNCYYEYAVRYRDASFCDKYLASEFSGRDRCLLKMAELLKDQSFCKKISATKEHSYLEQCQQLEKKPR